MVPFRRRDRQAICLAEFRHLLAHGLLEWSWTMVGAAYLPHFDQEGTVSTHKRDRPQHCVQTQRFGAAPGLRQVRRPALRDTEYRTHGFVRRTPSSPGKAEFQVIKYCVFFCSNLHNIQRHTNPPSLTLPHPQVAPSAGFVFVFHNPTDGVTSPDILAKISFAENQVFSHRCNLRLD